MEANPNNAPRRSLGSFPVWAIGVGLVISGESFGWNLGWAITGPVGFLAPLALVALMYYALVRSKIELACVYPEADGPHVYVKNAFGSTAGNLIAWAVLVEFLFVVPSIANAIGEYIGFLNNNSGISNWVATIFVVFFCALCLLKLDASIYLVIGLTLFAIAELFIYSGSVAAAFSPTRFTGTPYDVYGFETLVRATPYAIWMYLAIEGVSLSTKNIKAERFRNRVSKGYQTAFWTITLLILMVLLLAGGGVAWTTETWATMTTDSHPLPASMAMVLGKEHTLVRLFTFLGLFGLIASLQGASLAASVQLETIMKKVYPPAGENRFLAPFLVLLVSVLAVWGSSTAFLIELSVFGAVFMYFFVCLSLLILRSREGKKTPQSYEGVSTDPQIQYRHADFNPVSSGIFAWTAVALSLFAVAACIYLHPFIFLFCAAAGTLYFVSNKFRPNRRYS